MYPAFIKKAQEEGNNAAVIDTFTRAKLAEGYHAENYMWAYNNIDTPTDEHFYLLPPFAVISTASKDFEKCPICFTPAAKFIEY